MNEKHAFPGSFWPWQLAKASSFWMADAPDGRARGADSYISKIGSIEAML